MKKTLSLLLVFALLLVAAVGCGTTADTTDSDAAATEAPAADDAAATEAPAADDAAATEAPAADDAAADDTASDELTVIKVGASITPHAEILAECVEPMKELGYDLQVVEFTDYVQPNTAVENGDLLANYFQHQPYLDDFNENNGTHIVSVAAIHYEPFGMYPGKTKTLEDLQDGATIAIPNDGSNEARALYLLQDLGLITLKDGVGYTATVLDIADNPRNLNITEIEAAQLVITLQDVDFAIINGNYALQGGLSVVDDAVAMESSDSDSAQTYANILAVKEGNENDPAVLALVSVLQSEEIADFIDETYQGSVVAMTR